MISVLGLKSLIMRFALLFLVAVWTHNLSAQSIRFVQYGGVTWRESKRNAAYLELLGGTSLYSLNYQRISASITSIAFIYRVGASYIPGFTTATVYTGGLLGKPRRAAELLVGVGYFGIKDPNPARVNFPEEKQANFYLTPQLGYRSQNPRNGFLFRATLTPYLYFGEGLKNIRHTPGLGLSIGKVF